MAGRHRRPLDLVLHARLLGAGDEKTFHAAASPSRPTRSPGTTPAQQTFDDGLEPAIHTVVTGGLWQQEGRYGNVRVVARNEGWEHTRSFLYVQWLLSDEQTRQVRELLTLPVSALNESSWVNIQTLELIEGGGAARVRIRYLLRGEDGIKEAILAIGPPGEITLLRQGSPAKA